MKISVAKCNKCGKTVKEDNSFVEVEYRWGYQSIGKDGDTDKFDLCYECLRELRYKCFFTCNICKKSLKEVNAELESQKSGSRYYKDKYAAMDSLVDEGT